MSKRYASYTEWLGKPEKEEKLKEGLEKSGVPLEIRTMRTLGEDGFKCSKFSYLDSETGKYRDLDVIAFSKDVRSFTTNGCHVMFDITILGECKYSYNMDFLAFTTEDKYLPTFPVVFTGRGLLGASYQDFVFPMIIRKIAETNVYNLKWRDNFQDRKTHESCEKLVACFSYLYDRRLKRANVNLDYYRLLFGKKWEEIQSKGYGLREKYVLQHEISEFAASNKHLLSRIKFFPIEIGFPLMIIDENRGLIAIEYDEEEASVVGFKDVGYGIYPYVSEFADRYDNILEGYFAFPIIVCNLAYLKECIKTLNEGIEKMVNSTKMLLKNRPHAIIEEICKIIYKRE